MHIGTKPSMNVMTIELSNRKFYLCESQMELFIKTPYATFVKIIATCHFLGIFLQYSHRKFVGQIHIRL